MILDSLYSKLDSASEPQLPSHLAQIEKLFGYKLKADDCEFGFRLPA